MMGSSIRLYHLCVAIKGFGTIISIGKGAIGLNLVRKDLSLVRAMFAPESLSCATQLGKAQTFLLIAG